MNKSVRRLIVIINPQNNENFYYSLTSVIIPRPIAFISTISESGNLNLAPFSFFNAIASNPPTVAISIARNTPSKRKDTLANIEATREFVINIVVESITEAMNNTAAEYPEDIDEFEIAGLTPAPSTMIKPPRVLESPVNLECRLNQIITIGQGETESGLVLAEVIAMHLDDEIITDNRVDSRKLKAVGRLGGSEYSHTDGIFTLARPTYDPKP
jgi:flavin reductase (DIM6/NTAB) family NADH-FMN oxidoreductase RutF